MDSWAIVELMGHVRMAGKVSEEERFGAKLGRIDIPGQVRCEPCDGTGGFNDTRDCSTCAGTGLTDGFTTQFFSGSSIYRMTPVSEEVARAVAKQCQPTPVHSWELPKALAAPRVTVEPDSDLFDDDLDDRDI